jgi:O-antigen ligase
VQLLVVLAGLFFLVALWADRDERVIALLTAVTVVGFLVAVQGLIQSLTWNGKIYWVRKIPPASAFGPFVNHNHFAVYVALVLPVAISLGFHQILVRWRLRRLDIAFEPGRVLGSREDHRDAGRWGQGILALFAAAILVVSLFFSLSRGGILSACVSGLVLFVLIRRHGTPRLLAWSIASGLVVVVAALVLWIGADAIGDRLQGSTDFKSDVSIRSRAVVWMRVVRHLPEFVRVGAGLGAFEDSFAPYMPPGATSRWDKAHNDYLQILWETGLPGGVLLLAGIAMFGRRYWWPAMRSRDHPFDLLRLGIAVSLTSIALHATVDFNLQIGSNGFLFALLSGLLVALQHGVDDGSLGKPVLVQAPGDSGPR